VNLDEIFAVTAGQQIPGGCDWCHAYETTHKDRAGIYHLTIHHDNWCPVLARYTSGKDSV
jgi:hypothetical protein